MEPEQLLPPRDTPEQKNQVPSSRTGEAEPWVKGLRGIAMTRELGERFFSQIREQASSALELSRQFEECDKEFELREMTLKKQIIELKKKEEGLKEVEERQKKLGLLEASMIERLCILQEKEKDSDVKQFLEADMMRLVLKMHNEEVVTQLKEQEKLLQDSMIKKHEELEARKEKVDLLSKSIDEKSCELDMAAKEFDLKQREETEKMRKEAELMEKSFEERKEKLDLLSKSIDKMSCELDMAAKEFETETERMRKEAELMEKSLEERKEKLDLLSKSIDEKSGELDMKVKEFDLKQTEESEKRKKEAELMEKSFEAREKSVKEKSIEIAKEEEKSLKKLELRKKELSSFNETIKDKSADLEKKEMKLKAEAREIEVKKKFIESKEKEIEEKMKQLQLKQIELEERSKEAESRKRSWLQFGASLLADAGRDADSLLLPGKKHKPASEHIHNDEENKEKEAKSVKQKTGAKEIEAKSKPIELKEKEVEESVKEFELKQRELEERTIQAETGKRSGLEFESSLLAEKDRDADSLSPIGKKHKPIGERNINDEEKKETEVALVLCGETSSDPAAEHTNEAKGREVDEIFNCPDPDFSNKINCFEVDQVWALYDPIDDMPRCYAQIKKVFEPQLSVQVTWLEPVDTEPIPIACGRFKHGASEIKSLLMFAHEMHYITIGENVMINPSKGETWAVFRDWTKAWNIDREQHTPPYRYDFVEVVSEFDSDHGIGVAYLERVEGLTSVYERAEQHGLVQIMISPDEMFKFSHRVPSCIMTGDEKEEVPGGSFKLDPAALPRSLFVARKEEAIVVV